MIRVFFSEGSSDEVGSSLQGGGGACMGCFKNLELSKIKLPIFDHTISLVTMQVHSLVSR